MVTAEDPRLTQIRALCDYADRGLSEGPTGWVDTVDIRAVLDAAPVAATPPQDAEYQRGYFAGVLEAQDRIAEAMDPVPPQGIDRDALIARLQSINWGNSATRIDRDRFWGECADAILALVRPLEGVVLTPEEAGLALSWWCTHPNAGLFPPADDALASRLEAAQ